ncbi:MAG TPA: ParA family protein [Gammaproteobacteria bacterium]|nr:ParA family protein [Gammaproteobacteria bacterium]
MQTILVINSKGGSGKTTLATNLASLYAAGGLSTAMMDYDPQGSSLHWHRLRPEDRPSIHIIDASRSRSGQTRSWQLAVPAGTERLIIDAPAGVNGLALQEMLRRTDVIVIPVVPSPIDINATSDFIRDLLLIGKVRRLGIHVGVVANRVRRDTPLYAPLQRFLSSLGIPFITSLADTDNYIRAAESGLGIFELEPDEARLEREQWLPLVRWLACPEAPPVQIPDLPRLTVVSGGKAC